jgi:hypothetical protein
MPNSHPLRLTLVLRVPDSEGVVETVTESRTFEASDVEAQRAWVMEVRSRWPSAEFVIEDKPQWRELMQILDEMRCPHENVAHECPICADRR